MAKKNRPAFTFKDNFWSKKRVEQNVSVQDVAELLNINVKTAGSYFTGQQCPHEEQIKIICDFFDVDIIEGTREFINAHKQYDATHKRVLAASAKKPNESKKVKAAKVTETANETDIIIPKDTSIKVVGFTDNRKVIEKILYGTLSYDDFELFKARLDGVGDPLELIYDKVDYRTFRRVEKALERKPMPILKVNRYEHTAPKSNDDKKWEI